MALTELLVTYDVSANDDRARLAAYLCRHGVRLQRSVFQCRLESDDAPEFMERLSAFIDPTTDVLHVFRQCGPCGDAAVAFGQAPPDLGVEYWIV